MGTQQTCGRTYGPTGRWIALAALALSAAAMAASPASAADYWTDGCCADLEERLIALETTAARRGNRVVSLTVSGWVNQAVFLWDDGVEDNVYVGTNSLEQERFKIAGEAKIGGDWSVGYVLEVGSVGADSKAFSQTSTGVKNTLNTRKSSWFVKSGTFGKVTVGQDATATYHLLNDPDIANTRFYSDSEASAVALGAFRTRSNGALGPRWTDVMGGFSNATPGLSARRNVVRYDTPVVGGFTASAAWGEDDMWDAALIYAGEWGDLKVAARAGYGESTDPTSIAGRCTAGNGDCRWWGAAGTVMHVPTGLYVYAAYGEDQIDLTPAQIGADDTATMWFVQAGVERRLLPLGKTTIFAEYRNDDVGLSRAAVGSEIEFWAAGVVQNIENAGMDLYAIYRNASGRADTGGGMAALDDLDMVITGARIQF